MMNKETVLMRSLLFIPGDDEKLLQKASNTNADVLILDLEDAVHDTALEQARNLIENKLASGDFEKYRVYCRVNGHETGELLEDFEAVIGEDLDGMVYPDVTNEEDITHLDKLLSHFEERRELTDGRFDIIPMIENPSAVLHTEEIARASERVIAVAFGCEDYLIGLHGGPSWESDCLFVPRSLVAMGARAAEVVPIDTVYTKIHDVEGFEDVTKTADALGFEGSLVVHPDQVDIANEQYSPSEEEVEEAKKVLQIAEKMDSKGVDEHDGMFIGPPIIKSAEQTLDRHSKIQEHR